MNYFDQNIIGDETFTDQPDEIKEGNHSPMPNLVIQKKAESNTSKENSVKSLKESEYFNTESLNIDPNETEEDEDYSQVLNDARLRLEQGRLYELIMNHDLFNGVQADSKAIKNVQKEIRKYAQDRMEVMLGMKQEPDKNESNKFSLELFPFNSLEVEVLKSLASTVTKGASKEAEPLSLTSVSKQAQITLNPIGASNQNKSLKYERSLPPQSKSRISRKHSKEVQKILDEEGVSMEEIDQVFDPNRQYLTPTELAALSDEEIMKRNRQIKYKKAKNPNTAPMPTTEQLEMMYAQQTQVAESTKPGWRELMGMVKAMPIKK